MRIAREDQGAPQELPKTPRRSVSPPPYAKPLDSRIDSISRITLNRTPIASASLRFSPEFATAMAIDANRSRRLGCASRIAENASSLSFAAAICQAPRFSNRQHKPHHFESHPLGYSFAAGNDRYVLAYATGGLAVTGAAATIADVSGSNDTHARWGWTV